MNDFKATPDQSFPITPPPELVREWNQEVIGTHFKPYGYSEFIATRAAQWSADQELEACCEWLRSKDILEPAIDALRAARRPEPPGLKQRALAELEQLRGDANSMGMGFDAPTIRLALEALPND